MSLSDHFPKFFQPLLWDWSTHAGFGSKLSSWSTEPKRNCSESRASIEFKASGQIQVSKYEHLPFPQTTTVDGEFQMNCLISGLLIPRGAGIVNSKLCLGKILDPYHPANWSCPLLGYQLASQCNRKQRQPFPYKSFFFPELSKFTNWFRREEKLQGGTYDLPLGYSVEGRETDNGILQKVRNQKKK